MLNENDLERPHRFNGIGDASGVIATQSGSFEGIKDVDYAPECGVNVLSWSQLLTQGCKIAYNGERNSFTVTTPKEIDLCFVASQGLYMLDQEKKVLMTKTEEVQQKIALEIQKRLAYPAISGVAHFLKTGAIMNVPIGTKILGNSTHPGKEHSKNKPS